MPAHVTCGRRPRPGTQHAYRTAREQLPISIGSLTQRFTNPGDQGGTGGRMELRDIEIFLTLAEELHFGRNADVGGHGCADARHDPSPGPLPSPVPVRRTPVPGSVFQRSVRSVAGRRRRRGDHLAAGPRAGPDRRSGAARGTAPPDGGCGSPTRQAEVGEHGGPRRPHRAAPERFHSLLRGDRRPAGPHSDRTPRPPRPAVATFYEILAVVAAGEAVCTVPDEGRRYDAQADVVYLPLHDAPPVRWALIWRTDRATPLVRALAEAATDCGDATGRWRRDTSAPVSFPFAEQVPDLTRRYGRRTE